jgi:hypothetical protein
LDVVFFFVLVKVFRHMSLRFVNTIEFKKKGEKSPSSVENNLPNR